MVRYYLEKQTIHEANDHNIMGPVPDQIFHLEGDGLVRQVSEVPILGVNEGLLMVKGELKVEPLEVQIEFIKATNAEKWLEGIILRHVEGARGLTDSLWVLVEMKGGGP